MDRLQPGADLPAERDRLLGREVPTDWMRSSRLWPSTYSMLMKSVPSISPRSYTRQTLGWVTSWASVSSRRKRSLVCSWGAATAPHELEGDRLAEAAVDGLVDLAHAPRRRSPRSACSGPRSAGRGRPGRVRGHAAAGRGRGGGRGGDVVGKGGGAAGRTMPPFRHRGAAVRATHGKAPFATLGSSETLGNKRGAYATARGSSIYLRPDSGKCSGDLENEDGGADLDLVAGCEERVGDGAPVDENVAAVAQALQPPGRRSRSGTRAACSRETVFSSMSTAQRAGSRPSRVSPSRSKVRPKAGPATPRSRHPPAAGAAVTAVVVTAAAPEPPHSRGRRPAEPSS